jgi:hypothetical protein
VRQEVKLVQVAQVTGQERQSGEERYVPGVQAEHEETVLPVIVQLVQPSERLPQSVQRVSQTQVALVKVMPAGQERQPAASQVEQGVGQFTAAPPTR